MTADRRRHMTRLSRLVDGMVAPSVQKRGFVISRVVSQWRYIAGDMADWSRPAQLNLSRKGGGTLKVAIASGFGPIALQMKPSIIDRVNAAFGYRAVEDVTFVQTLPPQRESLPRKTSSQTPRRARGPLGAGYKTNRYALPSCGRPYDSWDAPAPAVRAFRNFIYA